MKKTVLIVILQQFADWEAAYLTSALAMLGRGAYAVRTVSLTREPVCSIGGFRVLPDFDLAAAPAEYEALLLIGGLCWREARAAAVRPLAEDCRRKGRVLGGICDAAAFLGTAGLLNDCAHTANDLAALRRWAGAAYTGADRFVPRQAVRDGNVVTANGTAPLEFAREVLLALKAADEAAIDEWYNFHKLGCYTAAMPRMEAQG